MDHIEYINNTLSQDREALLKKLTQLQKTTIDTQTIVDKLDLNNPTVKKYIEEFKELKQFKNLVTKKIIDSLDKDSGKTVNNQESTDSFFKQMVQVQSQMEVMQKQMYNLQTNLSENTAKIKSHTIILQDSGANDKAVIKQGFDALAKSEPELYIYCKTFYWTTLNLFGAYRSLSTGLITGNVDTEGSIKDNLIVAGTTKAISYGASIAQGIPFVGSVIGLLGSAIDDIYNTIKTNRFENKVNIINKIIQAKFGLEEDISLNVAKVALAITKAKKQTILYPQTAKISELKAGINWLQNKLDAVKDKVLPSVELNEKSNHAVQLALQDVTLVMAYLCKNYEAVIKEKETLDKQITLIVQHGSLDQLLIETTSITLEQENHTQITHTVSNTTVAESTVILPIESREVQSALQVEQRTARVELSGEDECCLLQ